jgi:ABC-type lipoprotein release transport system permease subunit
MNAGARVWVGHQLRRRWRAIAVLGLLVAVAGGAALAAIAGANRSLDVVAETMREHRQPDVMNLISEANFDWRPIVKLPYVESYGLFAATGLCLQESGGFAPQGGLCSQPPTSGGWYDTIWRLDALEGRIPTAPDEIAINRLAQAKFGWKIGQVLHVNGVGRGRLDDFWAGKPKGSKPWGPTYPVTVTGVFRGEDAWRVLSGGKGAPGFLNSASFMSAHGKDLQFLEQAFLRLRGGESDIPRLRADITRITGDPAFPIRNVREAQRRVERSTRVEADALTLFAAAVIAAAAVLLGQALIRLVGAGIGEARTLRSLGMSRPSLIGAMAAPGLVVGLLGAAGAVVIAVAASSRVPLGLADSFDLHPGTRFDAAVIVPGSLLIVAIVALVSLLAAALAVRRPRSAAARRGPGRLVDAVAALPLAPSFTLGVRMAIERRPGPLRVGPGLLGAVVAVLAVVAAITVRHGVDDTLTHPERAGQAWDLAYYPGAPEQAIAHDKDVAGAAHLNRGSADLDGVSVPVYGIRPVGRPLRMVVLDGRAPARPDEIALGPSTATLLHVGVGDTLRPGSGRNRSLRVVGRALLWEEGGHTAYDEGGWMTDAGFTALAPPEIVEERTFVDVRSGASIAQVERRLKAAGGLVEGGWPAPAGVSNLHTTRQVPALLGALLALLGAGAVGHGLVMTLRRRRRDVAVLRALGMSGREVRAMLVWQATTVAFVGLALGIPLGILVGHETWRWLAASMPLEYVAPGIVLAAGLVIPAAVLLVNAVATWPGRAAARLRPATALRAD